MDCPPELTQLNHLPQETVANYKREESGILLAIHSLEQSWDLPDAPAGQSPHLHAGFIQDLHQLRDRTYQSCKTALTHCDRWKDQARQVMKPCQQGFDHEVKVLLGLENGVPETSLESIELFAFLKPFLSIYDLEKTRLEQIMWGQLGKLDDEKEESMRQLQTALNSFTDQGSPIAPSPPLPSPEFDAHLRSLAACLKTTLHSFGERLDELESLYLSLLEHYREQEAVVRQAVLVLSEKCRQKKAMQSIPPQAAAAGRAH